jgi:glutaminyl-tRNA synthetase
MSKRKLLQLVKEGTSAAGTIRACRRSRGMRRRGYTPEAIRASATHRRGQARQRDRLALLEHCLREDLNKRRPARDGGAATRSRSSSTNYPEGRSRDRRDQQPEDPSRRHAQGAVLRELYIERDDFMEDPPRKFFRLAPGREVRLRYAYFVTCTGRDQGRRRRGRRAALHLRPGHARRRRARRPQGQGHDALGLGRARASTPRCGCTTKLEPTLGEAEIGYTCQFERLGYFSVDSDSDPAAGTLIFNRTVSLKDSWAKEQKKG